MLVLKSAVPLTSTVIAANACAQLLYGGFVAMDLGLVFTDLPARSVAPLVKHQAVPVLLQLPLVALQFALVCSEVDSGACLSRQKGSRTQAERQHG
jgi:hypothetical protein